MRQSATGGISATGPGPRPAAPGNPRRSRREQPPRAVIAIRPGRAQGTDAGFLPPFATS